MLEPDLAFVTSEQLIDELARRHDVLFIARVNTDMNVVFTVKGLVDVALMTARYSIDAIESGNFIQHEGGETLGN